MRGAGRVVSPGWAALKNGPWGGLWKLTELQPDEKGPSQYLVLHAMDRDSKGRIIGLLTLCPLTQYKSGRGPKGTLKPRQLQAQGLGPGKKGGMRGRTPVYSRATSQLHSLVPAL